MNNSLSNYPVIVPTRIFYLPKRKAAFGQADFQHPNYPAIKGPISFTVRGWADVCKKLCAKSRAKYAVIITCTHPALLDLGETQ